MKKSAVILLLFVAISSFAQTDPHFVLNDFIVKPPKYTGIDNVVTRMDLNMNSSINNYIINNFNYPAKTKVIYEGTEILEFTVSPQGYLSDFHVINSVSPQIDKEMIRILKTTNGKWLPGMNNEEPVAMQKQINITVRYSGYNTDFLAITRKHYITAGEQLLLKGHKRKALRHYNAALRYLPFDKSVLTMRGLCLYGLGDTEGAKSDWRRLKELGGTDMVPLYFKDEDIASLSGYSEMLSILSE